MAWDDTCCVLQAVGEGTQAAELLDEARRLVQGLQGSFVKDDRAQQAKLAALGSFLTAAL